VNRTPCTCDHVTRPFWTHNSGEQAVLQAYVGLMIDKDAIRCRWDNHAPNWEVRCRCATEITGKKMPCAANMAEFLRFQPRTVSKPLKSHDPICRSQKNRIWIGGSLTHLTHLTHRIFGASHASCSWSPMSWPAPDRDHESSRAAYLRGPFGTIQQGVGCSRFYGSGFLRIILFKMSANGAHSTGASNSTLHSWNC
jgi:hypothetical protein